MTGDLIRVLLVDDHAVVRAGVKAVLGAAKDVHVVGEAGSGAEALAMGERLKPDVMVMDISLGDTDGMAVTRHVVAKGLPSRVLTLTMHAQEDYLVPMLEAGAAGYVLKTAGARELLDAVRTVAPGEVYVPPDAARMLAKGYPRKDPLHEEGTRLEK